MHFLILLNFFDICFPYGVGAARKSCMCKDVTILINGVRPTCEYLVIFIVVRIDESRETVKKCRVVDLGQQLIA